MREEKRDEKRDGRVGTDHSHQTTLVTSKYYLLTTGIGHP